MEWNLKKIRALVFAVVLLAGLSAPAPADGDFYVVASGGGVSGKILKIQLFTLGAFNAFLYGSGDWQKLPGWEATYEKVSATSKLIIIYQDCLYNDGYATILSTIFCQIRVNNLPSDAGADGACLVCTSEFLKNSYSTTGVWSGIPKGNATLTIWTRLEYDNNSGRREAPGSVIIMEVEQ